MICLCVSILVMSRYVDFHVRQQRSLLTSLLPILLLFVSLTVCQRFLSQNSFAFYPLRWQRFNCSCTSIIVCFPSNTHIQVLRVHRKHKRCLLLHAFTRNLVKLLNSKWSENRKTQCQIVSSIFYLTTWFWPNKRKTHNAFFLISFEHFHFLTSIV